MITLRDYQQKAVAEIRDAFSEGSRRVLLVSPTGSGKTVMFAWIGAAVAAKSKRVAVLVHRRELVEQVSQALSKMGVPHGRITAGSAETDEPVQVAMIGTLARRLNRIRPFGMLILDEAHHGVAGSWQAVIDAMPDSFVLGVTATPERLDGRGLGEVFSAMIKGPSTADLTAAGYLVPARIYGPPARVDLSAVRVRAGDYVPGDLARIMGEGALIDAAVSQWKCRAAGFPTIVFGTTISHSQAIAKRFREAGVAAAHVDGSTDTAERSRLIASLGSGELQVLCNADLFGEGLDIPSVGAVILLRPTKSLARYLQAVGRALRPAPGKNCAIVLDHAACCWNFGLPDAPRVWSLGDAKRRRRVTGAQAPGARLRQCPSCGGIHPSRTPTCVTCGRELQPGPIEAREIEAEALARRLHAERINAERIRRMPHYQVKLWANTPDRVRFAAKIMGYKPGWIWHRLQELEQL